MKAEKAMRGALGGLVLSAMAMGPVGGGPRAAAQGAVSPGASASVAVVPEDELHRVRTMLSGYENLPPAIHWRRLGNRGLSALIALYNAPQEATHIRFRALIAAAHYPSDACRVFLNEAAQGTEVLLVRRALTSLGQAFGAAAQSEVALYLRHQDAAVREAAIQALGRMDDAGADASLDRRRAEEPDAYLRGVIDEALRH